MILLSMHIVCSTQFFFYVERFRRYRTFTRCVSMNEIIQLERTSCNGHTFEHIYDYDIKLETTKILVHVFDKV